MLNSFLGFDKSSNIGQSIEDFSILKIINQKGNNFVAKVRSNLDNKIYMMKRIEQKPIDSNENIYMKREKFFIKVLKNENIVKYYTDFEENNFLYLITEYVENGDLNQMIQLMNCDQNYKMNEERLMSIMLQCLKALSYLDYCGIIFCALKPDRILIDNDFNIKFTNFKYACIYDEEKFKKVFNFDKIDKKYLLIDYPIINIGNFKAPEMKQGNKYDKKIDVYSLGIVFCYLAYSTYKLPENNRDYSIEFHEFIKKLVNDCPTSRPKASEAYKELKNIYIKKFFNNSSIISYLRCLTSFPNMKDNFLRRVSKLLKEGENPILKKLYNFIDIIQQTKKLNSQSEISLNEKIKEAINEEIYDFLLFLQEKGIFNLKYKQEITPKEFSFILFKLIESELKLNVLNVDISIKNMIPDGYSSQNEKIYKILKYFNATSPVSDSFAVISKKEEVCTNCNNITGELFRKNQFLLIDIKNLNELHKNNLDINEIIKNNKCIELKEKICQNCKKKTNIQKRKTLFNLSKDLIIVLDRGAECKYKNFINFYDLLTIDKDTVELKRGKIDQYLYSLYGVLIRKEKNDPNGYNQRMEEYIYFTRDINENYFTRNDSRNTYNISDIKSEGDVMCLYYYCKDLDSYGKDVPNINEKAINNNDNEQNLINNNNNPNMMANMDTKQILNQVDNQFINNNNVMNNNVNVFNNQNNIMNNMQINFNNNANNANSNQKQSGFTEINNIKVMENLNNNLKSNNNIVNFNMNNQNNNNNINYGFNFNNQINNNQNFGNNMNMNICQINMPQNNFSNNNNFNYNNGQIN